MGKKAKLTGLLLLLAILFVWFNRYNEPLVDFIFQIIPLLTFVVNLVMLFLLLLFVLSKVFKKQKAWNDVKSRLKNKYLELSLATALSAMLGSLYYSNIALLYPCDLCWYQRILMYSLVLILFIAWYKKEKVKHYAVPMAWVGGVIALYHYVTQFLTVSTSCSPFESSVACSVKLVYYFGYITIPWMAVTAFALIILLVRFEE